MGTALNQRQQIVKRLRALLLKLVVLVRVPGHGWLRVDTVFTLNINIIAGTVLSFKLIIAIVFIEDFYEYCWRISWHLISISCVSSSRLRIWRISREPL